MRGRVLKAHTDPNVVEVAINARAARDRLRAIACVVAQWKRTFELKGKARVVATRSCANASLDTSMDSCVKQFNRLRKRLPGVCDGFVA